MKTTTPMLCSLIAAFATANAQDEPSATPALTPVAPLVPEAPPAPPVPPQPPAGMPGIAHMGGGSGTTSIQGAAGGAPAIEVPAIRVEQIVEPIRWQYMNSDFAAPGVINRKAPVAFFGVSASPPPSELAPHLPIDEDTGLVIEFISKDSPAEKAGLQERDVLAKLDEQILIHPRQLAVLLANHKDGDQVKITYVRKGQLHEANAVLATQEPKKTVDLFRSTSDEAPKADVFIYGDSGSPLKTFYRRVHKAKIDENGNKIDLVEDPTSGPGVPGTQAIRETLDGEKAELQEIRKLLEDLSKRLEEGAKE
ncbi:PDZ domain-containing protein [Luteolibacter luteus]|uniref:PDZ domain-containing protein n=1 Tax=Luteolibacter luteus TaxID=2728835 RepID=A0A858RRN7_9BACT|nr:PDZ domain-containing protein [Luteolibacter luteus]QJE98603.1 PDZ domain-containing protein [Luteolibacter luteus]